MIKPPKIAEWFLHWYCKDDLLEEIQGDLDELFSRRYHDQGRLNAQLFYWWNVLRFFRLSNLRLNSKLKTTNNMMLVNYFKTGFRNLAKDKVTSFINVFGLSLAIGCAITTYIFVDFFLNMDSQHTKKERIYQVINKIDFNENDVLWADISMPLGPELATKNPAVEEAVRVEYGGGKMKYGKKVFQEFIWFVDDGFLNVFDFPLKKGQPALDDKSGIIISQRIAQKYFGTHEAIGEQLTVEFDRGEEASFFVVGVFEEFDDRASFAPGILIPIDNFFDLNPDARSDWNYLADGLFILMKEGKTQGDLLTTSNEMVDIINAADPDYSTLELLPLPLQQLSRNNNSIEGSIAGGGNPAGRIALMVVSALLLLLACSNYVNIAVSSATKRLKEIALRKVMGGNRSQIIRQFLIENILTCLSAMLLGIVFAYFIFLPGFNSLLPLVMPFAFSTMTGAILFFTGLLLLVGLASGAYPALYISKFQPVSIFRGSVKFGQSSFLSRSLLVFQLFVAVFTIVASFIFTEVSLKLADRSWGYDPDEIVTVELTDNAAYDAIRNRLAQSNYVKGVSGSNGQISFYDRITTVKYGDVTLQTNYYGVNEHYDELMGINVKEGRFIQSENEINSAVVNEKMVVQMGWSAPLEQHFYVDSIRYEVVGVVDDIVRDDYYGTSLPAFFTAAPSEDYNYIIAKAQPGAERLVYDLMESTWKEIIPDEPFVGRYQGQALDDFYRENQSNVILITGISVIALILACIGLYGLVSFNIGKRLKEFSIRLVLGANLLQITKIVNRAYIWLLFIAFVLGAPLGFWAMSLLLSQVYPEVEAVTILPFIVAIIILIAALGLTVLSQILRLRKLNAAETLHGD